MRLRDAKLTQVCPDDAAITADTFLTLSVPCDGVAVWELASFTERDHMGLRLTVAMR